MTAPIAKTSPGVAAPDEAVVSVQIVSPNGNRDRASSAEVQSGASVAPGCDDAAPVCLHARLPHGTVLEVTGYDAIVIFALMLAGLRGVTALEVFGHGRVHRLSASVRALQALGVPILKTREVYDEGNDRYLLECDIEVVWHAYGTAVRA